MPMNELGPNAAPWVSRSPWRPVRVNRVVMAVRRRLPGAGVSGGPSIRISL